MRILLSLFAMLVLTSATAEPVKPNFTGEWVMDLSKSSFGPIYPPTSFVRKIVHHEPNIEIFDEQVDGSPPSTRKLTTDGQSSLLDIAGMAVSASIVWDGRDLVATTTVGSINLKFLDRITLSTDGNILTSQTHVSSPQGESDLTIVFERQR